MKKKKIPAKKESVLFVFREIVENNKEGGRYHTVANYVSFVNKLSVYLGEQSESFTLQELNKESGLNHILNGYMKNTQINLKLSISILEVSVHYLMQQ